MKCWAQRAAILLALGTSAWATQADRIPAVIDTHQAVTLTGSVNGNVQPEFDRGAVPPNTKLNHITLFVKRTAAQDAALQALLLQQQDPSSPRYHWWLTPSQYGDRFGLSRNDISTVTNWLESQGFKVVDVANGRNWIAFSGSAGQVERVFQTSIHRYQIDGEMHIANSTNPSVPKALEGVVLGLRGLDDFLWKPSIVKRSSASPDFSNGGSNYLAPDDIATIYDVAKLYTTSIDGTGQNLVIVGQSEIATSDLTQFRTGFNLPALNFQAVVASGCSDPSAGGDDEIESDLDLEWSGAVARNAKIILVKCDKNDGGVFTSAQYAIDNNLAPVISMSYGGCEPENGSGTAFQLQTIMQQANAEGITFIASSGDSGAAGCDQGHAPPATKGLAVNLPASVPQVTGAGGSEFNEGGNSSLYWGSNGPNYGSALSYIPEEAWNDTPAGFGFQSSGGGASIFFSKPTWQVGPGVPQDGARDVPDIAITASADHDGYLLCTTGSCSHGVQNDGFIVGGTSASAPVFAGMITLLNQYLVKNGFQSKPGLANINFTLYQFVQRNAPAFHDITTGNNMQPCSGTGCPSSGKYGYNAGVGYDQVTGVGSIDAFNFVTGWHAVSAKPSTTTVALSAPSVIAGANSTVTLTVTVSGASGTPTGTATLFNGSTKLTTVTLNSGTGTYNYSTQSLKGGTYSLTATYSGDATYANSNSTPAKLGVQDFSLLVSPAAVTVSAPGQSGQAVVTIVPLGGFSQTVNFSCSGLPVGATCSFTTVSATDVSLSITTMAAMRMKDPLGRGHQWFYALLLPGLLGILIPAKRGWNRRWLSFVLTLAFLGVTLWLVACGGGGGGSGGGSGTPAGTSTVTVTGTSGTLTHPGTLTLTVQ